MLTFLKHFCGAPDTPVLDCVDVCPVFQSQGGSLTYNSVIDSSHSPLLWHLLTSWLPCRQPSLFDPHICTHVHKHWWNSNRRSNEINSGCRWATEWAMRLAFWTPVLPLLPLLFNLHCKLLNPCKNIYFPCDEIVLYMFVVDQSRLARNFNNYTNISSPRILLVGVSVLHGNVRSTPWFMGNTETEPQT